MFPGSGNTDRLLGIISYVWACRIIPIYMHSHWNIVANIQTCWAMSNLPCTSGWWPPSLICDMPRHRTVFPVVYACCLTQETCSLPLEFCCYRVHTSWDIRNFLSTPGWWPPSLIYDVPRHRTASLCFSSALPSTSLLGEGVVRLPHHSSIIASRSCQWTYEQHSATTII